MKTCPDCQCKNPDDAATCKWCARDMSAVPAVPDVSALPKPAYVAEARRLRSSWLLILCYIIAFLINGQDLVACSFVLFAALARANIQVIPARVALTHLLRAFVILCFCTIPFIMLGAPTYIWPGVLAGLLSLFLIYLIVIDTRYLRRQKSEATHKP